MSDEEKLNHFRTELLIDHYSEVASIVLLKSSRKTPDFNQGI